MRETGSPAPAPTETTAASVEVGQTLVAFWWAGSNPHWYPVGAVVESAHREVHDVLTVVKGEYTRVPVEHVVMSHSSGKGKVTVPVDRPVQVSA